MSMVAKKALLSGDEAIARGAYESGVRVATGYPGTPSSEILENLARYKEVYVEWSVNEKVALETAIGASLTGVRSIATMKHVGLNVAADPLMTLSYVGVKGGLVVISADDPGMHSSQNGQDNRNFAKFAKIPLIEPSDSQEAKTFLSLALEISEEYDTPVLFRITTRIAHAKGIVSLGRPARKKEDPFFTKNPQKYVQVPVYARVRRLFVEERLNRLKRLSNQIKINRIEWGSRDLGIITHGVSYQYAREVFKEPSFLKLGMSYPLPEEIIFKFAEEVKKIMVVEEGDSFLEEGIRALGVKVIDEDLTPRVGELRPDLLLATKRKLYPDSTTFVPFDSEVPQSPKLPSRPPLMCPGCPHRGLFYVLSRLKLVVTGDIGCYSLAVFPPLKAMDTIICMGAGVGNVHGLEKASSKQEAVAVIGDSTFFHSGMTGLLDIVYNKGSATVIILDNGVTAMTGGQDHPGTGLTLKGDRTKVTSLEAVARALGVRRVRVIDPYDLKLTEKVVREELAAQEPSVVISRRVCILVEKENKRSLTVDHQKCTNCGVCLRLGCPALGKEPTGKINIDPYLCTGCELCSQVCKFEAVKETDVSKEAVNA